MAKEKLKEPIDVTLNTMRSLLAPGALDDVERVLRQILPDWTKKLAVRRDEWSRDKFDGSRRRRLDWAVRKMIRPGETYAELVEEFGPPAYERDIGIVTLTGASRGVLITMFLDDWVIAPAPTGYSWGNSINLHVYEPHVEQTPAQQWVTRACEAFCKAIEISHGYACVEKEYDARNKVGYSYTGLDPTRHLPGLYWLNVFGKPYVKLIGREKLISVPDAQSKRAGRSVIVQFGDDPLAWRTRDYRTGVSRALDHIGREYFFDKKARRRRTIAPKFKLQSDAIDQGKPRKAGGTVGVDVEAGVIRVVQEGRKALKESPILADD